MDYVMLTAAYIRNCRRGMKVDLWKLEGMDVPENKNISIFMSMLHDQDDDLF